ncbi:hypothetical protein H6F42_20320 [Pseudanabaena sp. FACHB-1998]|nr:hypothetical protein [Pseudanabaena sp. FACHB-1998]
MSNQMPNNHSEIRDIEVLLVEDEPSIWVVLRDWIKSVFAGEYEVIFYPTDEEHHRELCSLRGGIGNAVREEIERRGKIIKHRHLLQKVLKSYEELGEIDRKVEKNKADISSLEENISSVKSELDTLNDETNAQPIKPNELEQIIASKRDELNELGEKLKKLNKKNFARKKTETSHQELKEAGLNLTESEIKDFLQYQRFSLALVDINLSESSACNGLDIIRYLSQNWACNGALIVSAYRHDLSTPLDDTIKTSARMTSLVDRIVRDNLFPRSRIEEINKPENMDVNEFKKNLDNRLYTGFVKDLAKDLIYLFVERDENNCDSIKQITIKFLTIPTSVDIKISTSKTYFKFLQKLLNNLKAGNRWISGEEYDVLYSREYRTDVGRNISFDIEKCFEGVYGNGFNNIFDGLRNLMSLEEFKKELDAPSKDKLINIWKGLLQTQIRLDDEQLPAIVSRYISGGKYDQLIITGTKTIGWRFSDLVFIADPYYPKS